MSNFCACNFEAAMGHPAFQHKRGEPGFGCKYDPKSPDYVAPRAKAKRGAVKQSTNRAIAEVIATTTRMSSKDLRRLSSIAAIAAEMKHEQEAGRATPAPAPTDG